MADPTKGTSNPIGGMDAAYSLVASLLSNYFQGKQRQLNENASLATASGEPLPDPMQTLGMYADVASLPLANALNQINRIGGADVPAWDGNLLYEDVFRNAGYPDATSQLLGMATGVAEPGPGDLAKLAFFLGGPTGLQRLLGSRIHPSLKDPVTGIPHQTGHGTSSTYDAPQPSRSGSYGRGHYTARTTNSSSEYGDEPRFNDYTNGGSGQAPQVRLDTSVMENPFVYDASRGRGMMPAKIRPSAPDLQNLREWMEYAEPYSRDAQNVLNRMEMFDEQVDAIGDAASMTYDEFTRLLGDAEDAMARLRRARKDVPEVNLTQLLSRAYGIDGVVDNGMYGEIVSFDPRRNVVNTVDSAVEVARRMGFTDEEIMAADPEAWRIFQEGTEWADVGSIPTIGSMERWPLTPVGEAAIPTRETLMQVAERGGARDVADWLRQLGVPDEYAREVGDAAQSLAEYGPNPTADEVMLEYLRRGYEAIADPDVAADFMRMLEPSGPSSPLLRPGGTSDRELGQLRPFDEAMFKRVMGEEASAPAAEFYQAVLDGVQARHGLSREQLLETALNPEASEDFLQMVTAEGYPRGAAEAMLRDLRGE